jgi:DNA-binding NtrC family response regulator
MFKSMTELRFSNEDFRSSIGAPMRRTSDSISTVPQYPPIRPRVLVVEFRDEVYAGLKAVLEEHNCRVTRAEVGADVAGSIIQCSPDLVLVNESMPDESGWLVTCKLQVTCLRLPVWLYVVRCPQPTATLNEFTGVSRMIEYGGVLLQLVQLVRQDLVEWLAKVRELRADH